MFYFGTLGIIGLSTPENSYNAFVAYYLNFVDPLRLSLLAGTKGFLSILGFTTFFADKFTLKLSTGEGVRMVYSCIGYGVMSFWAAFIIANKGSWKKKAGWVIGGLIAVWLINVLRLSLLLLADQKDWTIPLWDHHTWFNIVAYTCIFGLIYFYDRSLKKTSAVVSAPDANKNLQALS